MKRKSKYKDQKSYMIKKLKQKNWIEICRFQGMLLIYHNGLSGLLLIKISTFPMSPGIKCKHLKSTFIILFFVFVKQLDA